MDKTTENQQSDIPCPEVLYRVALERGHIGPDGEVKADLFILRPVDEGKLSVYRRELVSLAVVEGQFRNTRGSVTLHTGRVRDAGIVLERKLDVVQDEIPNAPAGHAVIIGLPDPELESDDAEYAASILRDQCRLVRAESQGATEKS
jgi:hypothetical protein